MLSFALVNWGSSSAWIGAYFLGRIEKTMIHHKLLCSLKSVGLFSVLKNVSTNVHSNTFFMLKLLCKICQTVSLSMLINSTTA